MNAIKKNLNIFFNLTKRHIILFFKNKFAIFYSFMVPVVILVIYILFLKDLEINSINSILNEYGLILSNDEELFRLVQGLVDSWMLSGILAVSCITVSLQTNYILVRDKESDAIEESLVFLNVENDESDPEREFTGPEDKHAEFKVLHDVDFGVFLRGIEHRVR